MGAGSIIVNEVTHGAIGVLGIAMAHGLAIGLSISAMGHISGGHFNPAVTIAMLATKHIKLPLGIIYIATQLAAAVVAGLFLVSLFPANAIAAVQLGNPALAPGTSVITGILIETVLTFFLVLVIFGTAVDPKGARQLAGLGIGLTITMDILAGGPLTGAAMNPARSFGTAVPMGLFDYHYVYWIGPIVGALIAGLVYEHLFLDKERVA
ncbi:MAG: aquaporin [Dehalococcoidia bacterium]|nr:aquaporin [Dehalococcoidia bacterium]